MFFYFVGIDDRLDMRSQPNFASRSKVVSIYQCPTKITGEPSPQNLGRKKNIKRWTTFSATSALNNTYLRNETSHRQTKMLVSVYNVSPKRLPKFRDL